MIKPRKQLFRHKPSEGIYGDCHRTCYAMILDREPEGVPHFAEDGDENFRLNEINWLESEGLELINIVFPGEMKLAQILETMNVLNPDNAFILGGKSAIGCGHSVVCFEEQIYDPSLDNNGIVGPMSDGYYWITYVVRKI